MLEIVRERFHAVDFTKEEHDQRYDDRLLNYQNLLKIKPHQSKRYPQITVTIEGRAAVDELIADLKEIVKTF